jgi:two-component system response regulator MprA
MLFEDVAARTAVVDAPNGEELSEAETSFTLAGESGHRSPLTQVPCLNRGSPGFIASEMIWVDESSAIADNRSESLGEKMSASTVLVVEDDPDVLEVICEILEGDGRRPIAARDGREALRELRSGLRPCLIILDMLMPGMDGWQFRRTQKADEDLSKIPVVVVSGVQAARNSALQGGAVAFLPKPVVPEALLLAVASAC